MSLGLTLKLPKGFNLDRNEDDGELGFFTDTTQGNNDDQVESTAIEEEDQDIMSFNAPILSQHEESNGSERRSEGAASCDEDSIASSSSEDSSTPLPSLPMILVNIERLNGYRPSNVDEFDLLSEELRETLLGDNIGSSVDIKEKEDKDIEENLIRDHLSSVFISRTAELFEIGLGLHIDTTQEKLIDDGRKSLCFIPIPYPEFILLSESIDSFKPSTELPNDPAVRSTKSIWKKIVRSHKIPVVNRLLQHLSHCSRDLLWKLHMSTEIRRIVSEEKQKLRERQIHEWKTKIRPKELEKLYSARDTFDLKVNLAEERYDHLVKEREIRVDEELQRRLESGQSNGGVSSLDFDGRVTFAFPDEEELDMMGQNIQDANEYSSQNSHINHDDISSEGDDKDDEGYIQDGDSSSNDEANIISSDPDTIPDTPAINSDVVLREGTSIHDEDRKKRRMKAASKRAKRRMKSEQEKARMYELQTKYRAAKEEEELVRKMCISNEERMAKAVLTNLKKQLEKVDDLLDSLQEEAWKDEEEGLIINDDVEEEENDSDIREESGQMTLLDQILAMILGVLPPFGDSTTEDHYKFIKKEHDEIVHSWRVFFGRLPKSWNEEREKTSKEYTTLTSDNHLQMADRPSVWEDSQVTVNSNLSHSVSAKVQNKIVSTNIESLQPSHVPDDWEDIELGDIFPDADERDSNHDKKHDEITTSKAGLRPGGRMKMNPH